MIDIDRIIEADDNIGFCIKCGCEPDARECEVCGAEAVYGAEECLFIV